MKTPLLPPPSFLPHAPASAYAPLTPPSSSSPLQGEGHDSCPATAPILVYARWAGCAGGRSTPENPLARREHIYSAAIPPERPLRLGMRVRILATTPAWYSSPDGDPDAYDTYDAHIVGTITAVAGWKGRKVVLEIRNECALNVVWKARLRLPFVPDVMVQLDADIIPRGQSEAQETDIYPDAVVRARPGDARCGAHGCTMPWRELVGDGFLWEPMADNIGDRPGIRAGRKKVPRYLVSWEETAKAASRECERISYE